MKTIEETALEIARYAYDFDKADKEWLIGNLALMIRSALEEQRAIDHSEQHLFWIVKQYAEWHYEMQHEDNNLRVSFTEWINRALEGEE